MEMADLNAVLGEVILPKVAMSGKLKPRFTPAALNENAPAVDQTRGGEYGGQRRRYGNGWIKVSSGTEPNRAWFRWKMTVRELRRNNVSTCSSRCPRRQCAHH